MNETFKTIENNNIVSNYFDNNATTFIYDDEVKNEIMKWINCGNPSNTLHKCGSDAKNKIEECRKNVSNDLNVNSSEIYFTGCATESNNIIVNDIVNNWLIHNKGNCCIITDNIEHASILNVFNNIKRNNRVKVIIMDIDTDKKSKYYGSVNPEHLKKIIDENNNVIFMSFMMVNNETGAIFSIDEIGRISKAYNIFFHCDATQAIGKFIIKPYELNINAMTFSGHKFHALKGIGVLFIQNQCKMFDKTTREICSQFKINEQEGEVRGGTENVVGIVSLSKALQLVHKDRHNKNMKLKAMKNYIIEQLENNDCEIIKPYKSVDNTVLVILKGIKCCNKTFGKKLNDIYGISIGTSSACQASNTKSHVMDAMKINNDDAEKVIRISMCDYNTTNEVKYLVKSIIELLNKER